MAHYIFFKIITANKHSSLFRGSFMNSFFIIFSWLGMYFHETHVMMLSVYDDFF